MNRNRALVIGAGISGLLNARVLSDFFDEVIILEWDSGSRRDGTPQARHIHTLLARGRQIIENLYPDFMGELARCNIPIYDWIKDVHLVQPDGSIANKISTGIKGLGVSRPILESLIRELTLKISNIKIEYCTVSGLIIENAYVRGVQTKDEDIFADIVIDASGRNSKLCDWLNSAGYGEPDTSIVDPHLGYATRSYRIPDHVTLDSPSAIIQPERGTYRAAAAMMVEDRKMIITLAGTNKDYAPTEESQFLAFAQSLSDPIIANWIEDFEPISSISGFRAFNRWHHYERMTLPEHLLITGDSFCHFNPFYGQGMSVAALEAELLNAMLTGAFPIGEFHRKQAKIVNISWSASTIEDMRNPDVTGAERNLAHMLTHKFMDRLLKVSAEDENTARAFLQVMHLLKSPISLLHPYILWKMFTHSIN